MATSKFKLFGSAVCSFCFLGFGLLVPGERDNWIKAWGATPRDWVNGIKDLQLENVKDILKKLNGKCIKYKLDKNKENKKKLITLNYQEKTAQCNWTKITESDEGLTEDELQKLEKICEEPLWKNLTEAYYDKKHNENRLVKYNVCLNFAINNSK